MLHQLVHQGRSFSGHERNCCFLNTGAARFANISSISGLDLADDGRGVAIVDWDQDGDLDVWIVNRNAPQVRFLKNDVPTGNHFLALQLVGNGVTTNSDAIGARVELITTNHKPQTTDHRPQTTDHKPPTPNHRPQTTDHRPQTPDHRPHLRTLRAGDGFLSQSSKCVHFGLGEATQIDKAVVRWPGGEAEEFTGLEVDGRYRLVQGAGQAETWSALRSAPGLSPSRPVVPTSTDRVRVVSASPPPMPSLTYLTWDGDQRDVPSDVDGPLLLNLWASWCRPCIQELNELTARQSELREAGLNVLALCVDGLASAGASEPADARRVADELELPFAQGMATARLIDKLQIMHDELLEDHRELAVPVSCLVDRRGRLAVLYKGVADVDQLLADASQLDVLGESRRESSVPFPGRWGGSQEPYRLSDIVNEFVRAAYLDDAVEYMAQNHAQFASNPTYPDLLVRVGSELLQKGRPDQAEAHFHRALRIRPNHAAAHYHLGRSAQLAGNVRDAEEHYRQVLRADSESAETHLQLAMLLSAQEKHAEAIHHLRQCVRIEPDLAPAHYNLAVAIEQQHPEDAIAHYRRAVELDPDLAEAQIALAAHLGRQAMPEEALLQLRRWVEARPDTAPAHYNLAVLLERAGQAALAADHYRRTLQLDPEFPLPHRRLAAVLEQLGDIEGTVSHYRQWVRVRPQDANALNNLAWLLATSAEDGVRDGAEAVDSAERAAQLTKDQQPLIFGTLAAAYAEAGRFDEAVATATKAIDLARSQNEDELASQIEVHLEQYQGRKAHRATREVTDSAPD